LKKNYSGVFEGQLEIQNINDGIFTYDIIVHKKDSLGKMREIEYNPESKEESNLYGLGEIGIYPFRRLLN
jgi:hypothetical protein